MNEYYKLAAEYFKEFEPGNAFPGLNTYHWYLWSVSLAFFAYFGYEYFFGNAPSSLRQGWKLFAAEGVFLASCVLIVIKRFRLIVRATSDDSDLKPIERLASAKRARLETLLDRPAWDFMATANEIIELRRLEKACCPASDRYLAELWTKIYDPDSKTRLLTLITALLGLMTAFLGKNGALNIVEALGDENTLALIRDLAKLIVVTFIVCIAAYQVLRQLLEFLMSLFSSLFPGLHNRQLTLDYFVRDLIEYHRMRPPVATPVMPAPAHAPLAAREPGFRTLITAVVLVLLRLPSKSSGNAAVSPSQ